VYLAGLDGSGKSTQAQRFLTRAATRGERWNYRWARWEPFLSAPLMRLARKVLARGTGRGSGRPDDDEGYSDFTAGKQRIFRKTWARRLWTTAVLLEYLPQVWWRLGGSRLRGKRVLCDRYLPDLWVDLTVNFASGPEGVRSLARHPLCRLFPRIDRMIFLDVKPEIGFQRKSDGTPRAYLEERRPLYLAVTEIIPSRIVDANGSVEEVAEALQVALESGLG
jgi:thymidylate kinase